MGSDVPIDKKRGYSPLVACGEGSFMAWKDGPNEKKSAKRLSIMEKKNVVIKSTGKLEVKENIIHKTLKSYINGKSKGKKRVVAQAKGR